MTVSANLVMELRAQTNCPVQDCKQALLDANGDSEQAKTLLRQRRGNLDEVKTDTGQEGLLAVAIGYDGAKNTASFSIVEVGAETDFAARSDEMVCAASIAASQLLWDKPVSAIDDVRSQIGENICIRRSNLEQFEGISFPGTHCSIASYIHHDRKSAAVAVYVRNDTSELSIEKTDELIRSICMHIVASKPTPVCIRPEDVPGEDIERERQFLSQKAVESKKPQAIQDKIVEGGLRKYRSSVALLEQPYVRDEKKTVGSIIPAGISIMEFLIWRVGE